MDRIEFYNYWESLGEDDLAGTDIAEIQLRLSEGLPGAEDIVRLDLLQTLDEWARVVETSTQRWIIQYEQNPAKYEYSIAKFRALCMVIVIQRDLGIKYNMAFMEGPYDATDSRNNLLHGPLTGFGGTCATLPFLYAAIGRRLGYPLYIVATRQHLFVRWDDGCGERFNFETAGRGFEPRTDDDYREWIQTTDAEEQSGGFFSNFSRRRELACTLTHRGRCLMDNWRFASAVMCFRCAALIDEHERGAWAMATMVHRMVLSLGPGGICLDTPTEELVARARQPVNNKWQEWAVAEGEEHFRRIIELHRQNWRHAVCQPRDTFFARLGSPDTTPATR
ncbi:MAG: transglutaminase family protein [Pirellulaceae bacterium]